MRRRRRPGAKNAAPQAKLSCSFFFSARCAPAGWPAAVSISTQAPGGRRCSGGAAPANN